MGMQYGTGMAGLYGQIGQARAAEELGKAAGWQGLLGTVTGGLGRLFGGGGGGLGGGLFGGAAASATPTLASYANLPFTQFESPESIAARTGGMTGRTTPYEAGLGAATAPSSYWGIPSPQGSAALWGTGAPYGGAQAPTLGGGF
jgi:hypothetical protein